MSLSSGNGERAEVPLDPRLVAVLAVDARAEDLGAQLLELLVALGEALDLRGAHEGEVERIEEEDHPLAAVVAELHVDELAVDDALEGEVGCGLTYLYCHVAPLS